ncbi:MAG: FAD:protein FMN transferase [bacterium]
MKFHFKFSVVLLLVWQAVCLNARDAAHKKILRLMGSRFEITAVSAEEKKALAAIDAAIAEIRRIEKLISSWNSDSETSVINRNAGIQPVRISAELFDLIARSLKVSRLTEGAFDISFAAMDKIWQFDGKVHELPDESLVQAAVAKVNYRDIILEKKDTTVFLRRRGMKIGFGAIGKGYAANKARAIMKKMAIQSGLVNAGGDLIAWGKETESNGWQIGIADPKDRDSILAWLEVSDMAVVTSGNYEKFFLANGKRYAHIIDPRTGFPAAGLKSVTIVCPDAELADALATAVFVLGEIRGLELIDKLNGIEGLVINDNDEIKTSKNLQLNYYQSQPKKNSFIIGLKHEK